MDKKQQNPSSKKKIDLRLVQQGLLLPFARDEMNLAECPFTLLRDGRGVRKGDLPKTVETKDWVITGSDKYGLPASYSEEVYLGLLVLTKRQEFESRTVYFSMYELLALLGWSDEGKNYKRLRRAFRELKGVNIYAKRWWDHGRKEKVERGFNVIDNYQLPAEGEGKPGRKVKHVIRQLSCLGDGNDSYIIETRKDHWFEWSEVLFKSFQDGFIKQLDFELYLSLNRPIAKRLYRFVDKKLYNKESFTIGVLELCRDYLGVLSKGADRYPSRAYQVLKKPLDELSEKEVFRVEVERVKPDWMLTFRRWPKVSNALPGTAGQSVSSESSVARRMVEYFYNRLTGQTADYKPSGIAKKEIQLAEQLLNELGLERVKYLVDFAVNKAHKAKSSKDLKIARFSGITNYQTVAIAFYDKLKKEKQQISAVQETDDVQDRAWQNMSLDEQVTIALRDQVKMVKVYFEHEPTKDDWYLLRELIKEQYMQLPKNKQSFSELVMMVNVAARDYVRSR